MKKTLYHFLYFPGIALLLATACTTEDKPVPEEDRNSLRVTISDDEIATRSIVIDNPGIKLESFWKENDQIGVIGGSGENIAFAVAGGTISKDGKTAEFVSVSDIPSGQLIGYHPYSESAVSSDGGVVLDFPATQHYTMERGVTQPDPEACFMAGTGTKGSGISFVNLMAVLKVGQVFMKDTTVKSIEFRDLSGSPVCGPFSVRFDSSGPSASFTGDGKVLRLDLGSEGILAGAQELFIVFLVVPAREYPKGFEITFIAADGSRTVKTVGSKDGKSLHRSVVYPIGDISSFADIPGISYELKPSATMMTPDMLDLVKVIGREDSYVYTDEGSYAVDPDGNPVKMPYLTLSVHKDMNPQVGSYMVFNQPSTDMPQGGVYKITACSMSSDGQHWEVEAAPEPNFAAPFEQLTIGGPIYNADGSLNPDCGVDIDISSYIREIRDEEGNIVSMVNRPSYTTNAAEALRHRNGTAHLSFSTPDLTLSLDDGSHCTCDISTKMSVKMRIAIGVMGGELQYVYTKVNPALHLKTTFGLYGKFEVSQRRNLWTFYTAGIPVGPIVLLPEIGFDIFGGVGGEVKFTASTTFNYDLGTYGLIYNKGEGLSFKFDYNTPPEDNGFRPDIPDLSAGLTANLNAFAGIGMRAGISVYGLCSLGAVTDAKLTFGIFAEKGVDHYSTGLKLALTPEVDITPYTAVLGGKLAHLWKGISGKFEFAPIWERYLLPKVSGWTGVSLKYTDPMRIKLSENHFVEDIRVPKGTGPVEYKLTIEGKPFYDMPVVIDVYESSDFDYLFSDPEYTAAGLPHLYSNSAVIMKKPARVARKVIGVHYVDAEDGKTTLDYTQVEPEDVFYYPFQSGVAFNVGFNLLDGTLDGAHELLPRDETADMTGLVYYWPRRANGLPY